MLINLTYKGNPNDEMMHGMIGKGIIFDTGGYHLKPYGYYFYYLIIYGILFI
jgi:leucyl aminopeptidase